MTRPFTETPDFGTTRINLDIGGHGGFILQPTDGGDPGPWAWYAPSFVDRLPKPRHVWTISRLLAAGFSVCGVDVGESWGNPYGRGIFTNFHDACVSEFGLASKACLWCQSRGGLMHYNWAAEHPDLVKCIAGVYPLVNANASKFVPRLSEAYGMPEPAFVSILADNNPVQRLAPLAEAGVPIFHVHGEADEVVPLEQNSAELARRYEALGGSVGVLRVPGKGHEEVREFFECPELVEFFLQQK